MESTRKDSVENVCGAGSEEYNELYVPYTLTDAFLQHALKNVLAKPKDLSGRNLNIHQIRPQLLETTKDLDADNIPTSSKSKPNIKKGDNKNISVDVESLSLSLDSSNLKGIVYTAVPKAASNLPISNQTAHLMGILHELLGPEIMTQYKEMFTCLTLSSTVELHPWKMCYPEFFDLHPSLKAARKSSDLTKSIKAHSSAIRDEFLKTASLQRVDRTQPYLATRPKSYAGTTTAISNIHDTNEEKAAKLLARRQAASLGSK